MAESTPLVSVIVPTRNEAGNVGPLYERLTAALEGTPAELCFVDDSDDQTTTILRELEASHPDRVRCLCREGAERSGGLSTAVVAGLRLARGGYVCVMDADLQHPPETIPAMLTAARQGADLVVASRYAHEGSRGGLAGSLRLAVSSAARTVARSLFSEARRSSDPLSGFFLCRRALIDGIEFRPVGFKILLELLVCVPGISVRDVPLAFSARASGESKASMRQGLLFLAHLRSLFLQVEGSARRWKFALVGLSGLLVFLPVLALLSAEAHLPPLLAFVPAFALSLLWNTSLNRIWTFADQRRRAGGSGPRRYLENALLSGVLMLAAFALLSGVAHLAVVTAGALSALSSMLVNGLANRPSTRARPSLWTEIAANRGVQRTLERLGGEIGADRAYLLPPYAVPASASVPAELLARAAQLGLPSLWTEAASHRHQRRTNIELRSLLLVPVRWSGATLGVITCERQSRRGFDIGHLDLAVGAAEGLADSLSRLVGALHDRPELAASTGTAPEST